MQIHFFSSENLMVKYIFCESIKIHVFAKNVFIRNSEKVYGPDEQTLLRKTSLTTSLV